MPPPNCADQSDGEHLFQLYRILCSHGNDEPLIFVIATAAQLPQSPPASKSFRRGPGHRAIHAFALQIFSKGVKHSDQGLLLIVVCPDELNQQPYDRSRIFVLWSLLGDNASLTCVGLTYAGQRLDWPFRSRRFEPLAYWGRFRVDCQADTCLVVEDCQTLFAAS